MHFKPQLTPACCSKKCWELRCKGCMAVGAPWGCKEKPHPCLLRCAFRHRFHLLLGSSEDFTLFKLQTCWAKKGEVTPQLWVWLQQHRVVSATESWEKNPAVQNKQQKLSRVMVFLLFSRPGRSLESRHAVSLGKSHVPQFLHQSLWECKKKNHFISTRYLLNAIRM